MSLFSVYRYLSTTSIPFFTTTKLTPSSADIYWTHLQKRSRNIEHTLNRIKVKLDPLCLISVLERCAVDRPLMGLRFFIWAGLQPSYGHTLYMYNKARSLLKIDRNPGIIHDVLQAYWIERCPVSVKTFKVVLSLCKEAKLANEGLWVLRKMKDFNCHPDTTIYNIVIRAFCYKGDVDGAVRLLREISSKGHFPDMITYGSLVKSFVDAGRLDDGFGLFKAMKWHGCVPNTVLYSILIDGVCRFGSFEKALELLNEMEKGGKSCKPNTVTYTTVIQSLCDGGRSLEALYMLDRMRTNGCSPNEITLKTLIDGLCVEGHVEEAYKLLERVVEVGDISVGEGYSSLVISLVRVGNIEEAEKVFRILLAGGVTPDGLACSFLIRGLCLKDRVLHGYRLLKDIEIFGSVTSIDSDICSLLLAGLVEDKHLMEAESLADLMVDRDFQLKPPYRENVVDYLKKSGKIELLSRFFRGQKQN